MSDWLGMLASPRTPRPELKARVLARALAARGRPMAAYAAAAVMGAVAVGAGVWTAGRMRALEAARSALERRVSALEDTLGLVRGRHTRLVQIPVTTGGRRGYVTIIADTVTHRWLVRCENLAPNDPDQAYQLWFVTETGVLAAKLMPMDTDEPMIMVLDLPSPGVVRVRGAAMSIEPRAGSTEPTGPVVFRQLL